MGAKKWIDSNGIVLIALQFSVDRVSKISQHPMKADQRNHRVQRPTVFYTIDTTMNATELRICRDLNDTVIIIIIDSSEYLCNIAARFSCISNEYDIFKTLR
jgi:hypothetical protein